MIAIVSDIHSNLEALTAVFETCERLGVKEYLCLGDVIGYGPNPLEVTRLAQRRFASSLMGNHEEALVTRKHRFNPHAAQAIDWTRKILQAAGPEGDLAAPMDWFKARTPFALRGKLLMVHGSIYDPVHDYVDEPENPVESQQMIETLNRDFAGFDLCFAGHNHTPFLSTVVGTIFPHDDHREFTLPPGHKAYVCVGSVGQPRDRDPRASFATLDGDKLTFHRIDYNFKKTQEKITAAGLNLFLAERLALGM
jgi:diadenosine tetraphosphatase ApaH/serine/threonine PP2A family protein phosphatase